MAERDDHITKLLRILACKKKSADLHRLVHLYNAKYLDIDQTRAHIVRLEAQMQDKYKALEEIETAMIARFEEDNRG